MVEGKYQLLMDVRLVEEAFDSLVKVEAYVVAYVIEGASRHQMCYARVEWVTHHFGW